MPFQEKKKYGIHQRQNWWIAINSKKYDISDHYSATCEFKKDYQNRSNLVKKENCDLLADFHNILNMKSYFVIQSTWASVIFASATQRYHAYMPHLTTVLCVIILVYISVSIIFGNSAAIYTEVAVARYNSKW
jgi:hypothetical protein